MLSTTSKTRAENHPQHNNLGTIYIVDHKVYIVGVFITEHVVDNDNVFYIMYIYCEYVNCELHMLWFSNMGCVHISELYIMYVHACLCM